MNFDKHLEKMITRLMEKGITDDRVLKAMRQVPRHEFVPHGLEFQAYEEKALPIGYGQTISHPYTVALMTQVLNVSRGQKILEIGTGSGYQAAMLCALGAQVFTIERLEAIAKLARKNLDKFRFLYLLRVGDGSLGWQNYAPYDSIIVTAGAPVTAEKLLAQLKDGGQLLIPIGKQDQQMLTHFIREGDGYRKNEIERLKFVPLIGKQGW